MTLRDSKFLSMIKNLSEGTDDEVVAKIRKKKKNNIPLTPDQEEIAKNAETQEKDILKKQQQL